ncbi:MAG: hypothetical protein OXC95_07345 [Dehalococcoidia bacterium]|nr:hypothetical protein [Dehalococcoidia bacterium]
MRCTKSGQSEGQAADVGGDCLDDACVPCRAGPHNFNDGLFAEADDMARLQPVAIGRVVTGQTWRVDCDDTLRAIRDWI